MGNSQSYVNNYSLEKISKILQACPHDELKKEIYKFIPVEGTHLINNDEVQYGQSLALKYVMQPLFGTENNIENQLAVFGPSPSVRVKLSTYQNKRLQSCFRVPHQ